MGVYLGATFSIVVDNYTTPVKLEACRAVYLPIWKCYLEYHVILKLELKGGCVKINSHCVAHPSFESIRTLLI